MLPVGLHRGGYTGIQGVGAYNYGSPFTEIIKSIDNSKWHPQGNYVAMWSSYVQLCYHQEHKIQLDYVYSCYHWMINLE